MNLRGSICRVPILLHNVGSCVPFYYSIGLGTFLSSSFTTSQFLFNDLYLLLCLDVFVSVLMLIGTFNHLGYDVRSINTHSVRYYHLHFDLSIDPCTILTESIHCSFLAHFVTN